jgi:hypothetical protein
MPSEKACRAREVKIARTTALTGMREMTHSYNQSQRDKPSTHQLKGTTQSQDDGRIHTHMTGYIRARQSH